MHKSLTQTWHSYASELGKLHAENLLCVRGLALETFFPMTSLSGLLDRSSIKLPRAAHKGTVPAVVGLQRARTVAIPFAFATQPHFAF